MQQFSIRSLDGWYFGHSDRIGLSQELDTRYTSAIGGLGNRDHNHADVVFAPAMFPGRLYEGHDEVLQGFYELVFSLPAYRPEASRFTDLAPDAFTLLPLPLEVSRAGGTRS